MDGVEVIAAATGMIGEDINLVVSLLEVHQRTEETGCRVGDIRKGIVTTGRRIGQEALAPSTRRPMGKCPRRGGANSLLLLADRLAINGVGQDEMFQIVTVPSATGDDDRACTTLLGRVFQLGSDAEITYTCCWKIGQRSSWSAKSEWIPVVL